MSVSKTRSFGVLVMIVLITAGSVLGCYTSLNSMYAELMTIFENGENGDGICIQNDLDERVSCAVNMCTVARRYLSGSDASLIDELSDAAGVLKSAVSMSDIKDANEQLEYAMSAVYNALEGSDTISDQDKSLYRGQYSEFTSRGDTIRHDAYNTAATEYNEKTSGIFAGVIKLITPAKTAVVFY